MKTYILYISIFLSSITLYAQNGKINHGDKLFDKFSYVKAIEFYQAAYDKNPNNIHVNKQLGDCYMLLRQPQHATQYYKKVVKSKDVDPKYYYVYAQALRASGDYKKSEKWMSKFKATGVVDSRVDQFFNNLNFIDVILNRKKRYTITNSSLNTKNSDYGAIRYKGDTYFVSARENEDASVKRLYNWNNQPFLDIFKINDSSSTISRLEDGVNTKFHEGAACFTPDGKYMFFTRNNYFNNNVIKDDQNVNNLKIFKAEWLDGKWSNSKPLFFSSDSYSVGHPSISTDGKKLFFTSDMPGGFGGTDIYVSEIHERGGVRKPMNLGSTINTEGNEMFPFYHTLENKLYFSSEGHVGLGQLDVFVAEYIDNDYTNVTNLGEPINSISDDFAYNLNDLGSEGFIASNREGGVGDDDIYTFTRERNFTLKGIITDKVTQEPIEKATVILSDSEGNIVYEIKTGVDGYYEKLIDRDHRYQLNGDKPKFKNTLKPFSSFNQESYTEMIVNLELDPLRDMNILADLSTDIIYFDFDKSIIREDAKPELNKIIAVMNKYKDMIIHIESHTDSRGTAQYNERLSSRRAASTYNYFIEKNISPDRITSHKGYGEYKLTNNCGDGVNCSDDEHQANRRTEFIIEKMN
jgi:outer membrane protein OmpA-like peptidoglycan-associated protein